MKVVELGNTGQKVSQLSLGCMQMGTLTSEEESRQMLDRYVEQGGNFLDTANCYGWFLRRGSHGGESEAVLGRWLAQSGKRGRVFLATKGAAMVRSPDAHARAATGQGRAEQVVEQAQLAFATHPGCLAPAHAAHSTRGAVTAKR